MSLFVLACGRCEVVGPRVDTTDGRLPAEWLDGHAGAAHDVRMMSPLYDPEVPWPGWLPRMVHGPWAPHEGGLFAQRVACPYCRSADTMWMTVNHGANRLVFCRACGTPHGPAVNRRMLADQLARRMPTVGDLVNEATPVQ